MRQPPDATPASTPGASCRSSCQCATCRWVGFPIEFAWPVQDTKCATSVARKKSAAQPPSVLVDDRTDQDDVVFFAACGWLAVKVVVRHYPQTEMSIQG